MTEAIPTNNSNAIKMGMLQTVRMAQAFAAQAETLSAIQQKNESLQAELNALCERQEHQKEIIDLGVQQMDRLRKETEARLRAITLYTRDEKRLKTFQKRLSNPNLSPHELMRWHEMIQEEFRLLYPNRPLAKSADSAISQRPQMETLTQYRFRS